jgi:hypothetical protein
LIGLDDHHRTVFRQWLDFDGSRSDLRYLSRKEASNSDGVV